MKPLRVTETIAAPPERVFALATDLAGAVERVAGIDAIEVLTDGPFGVGTRWRETRTLMGREATEVMEVSEYAPGASYTTVAESHGCRCVSGLICEPVGEGTRATFHLSGEPTTLGSRVLLTLMAPLNWLMLRQVRKCLADDLADLRAAAETAS